MTIRMFFRAKLFRFKRRLLRTIRLWLRCTITFEKFAILTVVICAVFILVCNHILIQNHSVIRKSSNVTEIHIQAGTLRLPQDDPRILTHVRKLFIRPRPVLETVKNRNLIALPKEYSQSSQITAFVLKLLKNQTSGYFVEYPAKDGVIDSLTILLENVYNWTGLLIEHDPRFIYLLKQKQRYCWISTACLSTRSYPEYEEHKRLLATPFLSNNLDEDPVKLSIRDQTSFFAQCFPLYSILLSLNITTVDFLSLKLDNPAAQLAVLKTLPFKLILPKVISVDIEESSKEYRRIFQFVTSQGYLMLRYFKRTSEKEKSRQIYIHKSLI